MYKMCFGEREKKREQMRLAEKQVATMEAQARLAADQNKQAAIAAAQSAENLQKRAAVTEQAAAAVSTPIANAEIQLDTTDVVPEAEQRRRRKQAYGTGGYQSGVAL